VIKYRCFVGADIAFDEWNLTGYSADRTHALSAFFNCKHYCKSKKLRFWYCKRIPDASSSNSSSL